MVRVDYICRWYNDDIWFQFMMSTQPCLLLSRFPAFLSVLSLVHVYYGQTSLPNHGLRFLSSIEPSMFWGSILNETCDRGVKMLRCEELLSFGHLFALHSWNMCHELYQHLSIEVWSGFVKAWWILDDTCPQNSNRIAVWMRTHDKDQWDFWSSLECPRVPNVWQKSEISTESQQLGAVSFNPPGCPGDSQSIAFSCPPKNNTVGFDTSKYSKFSLTVAMNTAKLINH